MTPDDKLTILTRPALERLFRLSRDAMAATAPLIARGYLSREFAREIVRTHDQIKAEIEARGGDINDFGGIEWSG